MKNKKKSCASITKQAFVNNYRDIKIRIFIGALNIPLSDVVWGAASQ